MLLGLLVLGFAAFVVRERLKIDVVGTIAARHIRCDTSNRCRPHYEIVTPSGERVGYVAGGNDQALTPDLQPGQRLSKRRWELNYSVDDRRVYDFPVHFYAALTLIGLALLGHGIVRARRAAREGRATNAR